jgi:hypothetical protein
VLAQWHGAVFSLRSRNATLQVRFELFRIVLNSNSRAGRHGHAAGALRAHVAPLRRGRGERAAAPHALHAHQAAAGHAGRQPAALGGVGEWCATVSCKTNPCKTQAYYTDSGFVFNTLFYSVHITLYTVGVVALRARAKRLHPRAAFVAWANWALATTHHAHAQLASCVAAWLEVRRTRSSFGAIRVQI